MFNIINKLNHTIYAPWEKVQPKNESLPSSNFSSRIYTPSHYEETQGIDQNRIEPLSSATKLTDVDRGFQDMMGRSYDSKAKNLFDDWLYLVLATAASPSKHSKKMALFLEPVVSLHRVNQIAILSSAYELAQKSGNEENRNLIGLNLQTIACGDLSIFSRREENEVVAAMNEEQINQVKKNLDLIIQNFVYRINPNFSNINIYSKDAIPSILSSILSVGGAIISMFSSATLVCRVFSISIPTLHKSLDYAGIPLNYYHAASDICRTLAGFALNRVGNYQLEIQTQKLASNFLQENILKITKSN